ncbi:hypothetical protein ACFX59_17260 [Sphingomonas sp. NCPPB 2930]|uniref:hypothetical protein n=1 Tax=Sphingomonas sp. NCPPB 2930 TaxID=3162788 RepID=UPI0036DC3A99
MKYAVIRALEARHSRVRFFEIREQAGRFTLAKRELYIDELASSYPRRARLVHEAFKDVERPQ